MPKVRYERAALGMVFVLCASACVTLPPNSQRVPQDPWESWNRGVYKFNDKLDRAVAKPVARAYVRVLPKPIRTGISNFFDNLETPTVMINDALQGKIGASANDLGRFLLNSTVGLGGLLDPATSAGLNKNNEDFGQTLSTWANPPGVFFPFLPLFPTLAAGMADNIPCRPFSRWCVAPSCVARRATPPLRNGHATKTSG